MVCLSQWVWDWYLYVVAGIDVPGSRMSIQEGCQEGCKKRKIYRNELPTEQKSGIIKLSSRP